jgi:hypothetical protein
MQRTNANIAADLAKGALAGAAGTWAMDRVDWLLYDMEPEEARRRTQRVRPGGLDPAHVIANEAAKLAGRELRPRQPHPAGVAIHYGVGIGPAAAYAAARDRRHTPNWARGALLGIGAWLIADEGFTQATGIAARPWDYPWQSHARSLAAHVVYGLVTEATLAALDAAERRVAP